MLQKGEASLLNLIMRKLLVTWARTFYGNRVPGTRLPGVFSSFVSFTPCNGPMGQACLLM